MSKVHIFLLDDGAEKLFYVADEAAIKKHSKTIRDALVDVEPGLQIKEVLLQGASPGPLRLVLNGVLKHGDKFHFVVGERKLNIAVGIYQAIEALQLEPAQPHVEGHIIGHLSHDSISPVDLSAVQKVFAPKDGEEHGRVYWNLVHNTARRLNLQQYSAEEFSALEQEAAKYPVLHTAIHNKIVELNQRTARWEQLQKEHAGRKGQKNFNKEQKKRRLESKKVAAQREEQNERRRAEEAQGLRDITDAIASDLLQQRTIPIRTKSFARGKKAGKPNVERNTKRVEEMKSAGSESSSEEVS